MKRSLYPRLAVEGIRKNKRLYVPYFLSCAGTVAVGFILQALSYSPALREMRGGSTMEAILTIGKFVIALFGLLFLLYTNSFITKNRFREYGLYAILGMTRRNIARVVLWESLITAGVGLGGGILAGILFSKAAELGLINLVNAEVNYRLTVPVEAIGMTVLLFGAIFVVLTLKSLIAVRRAKPLDLLHSTSLGEKPLKANWVFAVLGTVTLAAAYALAVSIQSPLDALALYFVAVLMVIAGTYMLFMAGSVALCRLLMKNKRYYYKKQHFVSVSNMAFRMKRHGAGLASICILSTMVLVMITSSGSLYFGKNNVLAARYPEETYLSAYVPGLDGFVGTTIDEMYAEADRILDDHGFAPARRVTFRYAEVSGLLKGDTVQIDASNAFNEFANGANFNDLRSLYFVSLSDYNAAMGTDLTLQDGEAMLFPQRCRYDRDTLTLGGLTLNVVPHSAEPMPIGDTVMLATPAITVVVKEYEALRPLETEVDMNGMPAVQYHAYYGFDGRGDREETLNAFRALQEELPVFMMEKDPEGGFGYSCGCVFDDADDFYSTYGGLFFIGIVLSAVFIAATVVIIYYKQITEGYEDRRRFEIMRNVGMTSQDIKKTVNSQILTVFYAPLILAGVHLTFSFPMVWKILLLFGVVDLPYVILITAGAYVVFAAFYALIYKLTARAYFNIVTVKE